MIDKHIGEQLGELKVIALSQKPANGYLNYYWTLCSCGNLKRYRYDQARKIGNCGLCEDFRASKVNEVLRNGEND